MSQLKEYTPLPQHVVDLHSSSRDPEVGMYEKQQLDLPSDTQQPPVPSICGMPLKYVSLVTLAVQNALLTLIMHYSRVSSAPQHTYSAASAVLLVELLKGFISLSIAFMRLDPNGTSGSLWSPREVFRPDCWKLSVPAILYVIQNNLQFVAVSNLEAATFQVSYQMKILTTAAFSVVMLRKKLSSTKWLALLFLALGVGIVQIQNGSSSGHSSAKGHDMNAFKGFMAVVMACFTSGLAGVYFEMVLKNSQADLWVRNVQLSLFSLLPAIVPIICTNASSTGPAPGWLSQLFANFGVWAWATVLIQVIGGLLTALVIKYADNILKGFATSLSIVISFLASVALFNFQMTLSFILGSTVVLVATWMYNQPDAPAEPSRWTA
ncbi:nucleotide-sugar transporter-domain-containing protein [Daedaleopsis nitida]|nr:nucleotide-sugar transporter-domain-containing protein [Daedaleopsis nitida]